MFKIRNILHKFFLRKKLKTFRQHRKTINLDKAKSVGILFYGDSQEWPLVENFKNKLLSLGKKVEVMGYSSHKGAALSLPYACISPKNLNFANFPKGEQVNAFIQKDFDILINAYVKDIKPLIFISTFSRAKFRVGLFRKKKTYYCDFMIDTNEQPGLQQILEHLEKHLKQFKIK